jgi:putative endonuclease
MKGFVYVLKSLKDSKSYIGSSLDPERRFAEHNKGLVKSTKSRRPFELKYILEYEDIKIASKIEKKFKRSSGTLDRELKQRRLVHR